MQFCFITCLQKQFLLLSSIDLILIFAGNYTLAELSLVSEDGEIRKVPGKSTISSHKNTFATARKADTVNFTTITGVKLRDNPRQIILPEHFDGRIQIDVRSFCIFLLLYTIWI